MDLAFGCRGLYLSGKDLVNPSVILSAVYTRRLSKW